MHNERKIPELTGSEKEDYRKLLDQARTAFDDRRDFLDKRERSFRFYMPDARDGQWGDMMVDPQTGREMTEAQYIRSQGRMPAQNNQVGTIVRNLIGQFRNNYPDPVAFARNRDDAQAGEIMTAALQRVINVNEGDELDARNFEEFMVSAGTGWKISFKWWSELNTNDVFLENIDQTRFFYIADSNDVRNTDVWLCGELHDMRMDDIIAHFAQSKADADRLREMFPNRNERYPNRRPDYIDKSKDFYMADDPDLHRIIEVWHKQHEWVHFVHDSKNGLYKRATDRFFIEDLGFTPEDLQIYSPEELVRFYNQHRLEVATSQGVPPREVPMMDMDIRFEGIWKVCYLSPLGDVLYESETPFEHEGHPYIFGHYPLMDGMTQSIVYSVIDQQKYINRLISLMDTSMSTSVKNLMYVPRSMVPDDMTPEEFAQQSVELNGYIFYEHDPNTPLPQPIKTNSNIAGAQQLLALQMNLLQDITAVNEAVQGGTPPAGTPASLYAQQVANAAISNKDLFDFYFALIRRRNRRIVQVMQQFYSEKRYIKIAGSGFRKGVNQVYDPNMVQGIDFDVVIGETQNTLAYRQMIDGYLKQFLDAQYITFGEYLKHTSLPFAERLLQTLENRSEGQLPAMNPELMQQLMEGEIPPEMSKQLGKVD